MNFREYIQKIMTFITKRKKGSIVKLEKIKEQNFKADARIVFSENERCKNFRKRLSIGSKKIKKVIESNSNFNNKDKELFK